MNEQDMISELKQTEERLRTERFRIKGIIKVLEKVNSVVGKKEKGGDKK